MSTNKFARLLNKELLLSLKIKVLERRLNQMKKLTDAELERREKTYR